MSDNQERSFTVISQLCRFGYGWRIVNGRKQYFAWHGYPNRDSDYFTTAEISPAEYAQIMEDYPKPIDVDREKGEVFRNKYVNGHRVIMEGWDKLP